MPKLDATHLFSRLVIRLEQLEAGEEIAAKELRSLLTTKQLKELDDAWKKQQELRKGKRARTPEEEKALGWKTKREVRIEVFKDAIAAADVAFHQFSRHLIMSKLNWRESHEENEIYV